MRKYVSLEIIRSIYFAIFHSSLFYCCLVCWAQNCSTIQEIVILWKQTKLIQLLIDKEFRNQSPIQTKLHLEICLENILFVSKSLINVSPSVLNTWFSLSSVQHFSLSVPFPRKLKQLLSLCPWFYIKFLFFTKL